MLGVVFVLALFFGLANYGYAEEKGLIGLWKFDEGKGNIVKDLSGNGNDGKIHGAAWVKDKLGKALSFDGIDDCVTIQLRSSLDSKSFTIELWINPAYKYKVSENDGFFYSAPAILRFSLNKGRHKAYVRWKKADANYASYYFTKTAVPQNKWSHLAFTYDNETDVLTGYRNGKLGIANANVGGIYKRFGGLIKIGYAYNTGKYFKGAIDEVKIYNRALTAQEIKNHYDTEKAKTLNIPQAKPLALTFDIKARNAGDIRLVVNEQAVKEQNGKWPINLRQRFNWRLCL